MTDLFSRLRITIRIILPMILCFYSMNNFAAAPVVETDKGKVRGLNTAYGAKFLGIPYAAPPTKQLRWKPPQAVQPWKNTRSAATQGALCPQFFNTVNFGIFTENCLYLNVYQPETASTEKKPVLVWIHGGGLTYGTSAFNNPEALVKKGTVVVTFNYRLGALGFMSHPALTKESPNNASGNYGLMDQQAVLQWVQNNINRFGGDPNNVTIFGQSAGGLSVHIHMASPSSKGLFHKAIVHSTGYSVEQPQVSEWELLGLELASKMGCPNQNITCLRNLTTRQIVRNQYRGQPDYLPVVDGVVLTQSLKPAFEKGEFTHVPVLQGSTKDEFSAFISPNPEFKNAQIDDNNISDFLDLLYVPLESKSKIPQEYNPERYNSYEAALADIGTDFTFACPTQLTSDSISKYTPLYKFEFADKNAPNSLPEANFPYGAYHGSDLQYLFPKKSTKFSAEQEILSDKMITYWSNFIKSGNPNDNSLAHWPRYRNNNRATMALRTPNTSIESNFSYEHHCEFWNKFY